MFKFLLISIGFIAACYVAESEHVPLAIPAVLQDMIPKESKLELANLTPEQHKQLEEAFRKYGANAKAISNDLEEKHPDLAKKVSETMGSFEKKIEKLDQKGKDYIGDVIKALQNLKTEMDLKETAKTLINDWNELDDETKDNVKEAFPSIPKVLSSDKFKKIAESD
ncbi:Fatty-acid and retinol-binding protein 4 [Aphelenchoides bicaudatus]|nr:Fatty-acid and retinol-binding protein 4 [Aphelenchoides bicaudatus]